MWCFGALNHSCLSTRIAYLLVSAAMCMDHEGNIKAFNERCGAEGAIEACIARWPEEERVLQACEIVTQEMVSLES
jgi:hypothetical protein